MVTSSRPPPATAACSGRASWCLLLLLLQLHMSRGFLVPAPRSLPSPGAADVAVRPATASAEAEGCVDGTACGGTTLSGDGSAVSGAGPSSSVMSAFREFVERRKSGAPRVVVDLRPGAEFRRRHLEGSTSIPIDELAPRLLELPPPFGQPVSIVGNEEDRRAASEFLTSKGWQIDARIRPDLVAVTGAGGSAEAWPTEAGSETRQVWRANEFLEFCTERYLLPSGPACDTAGDGGVVLDLGCGSGRDTVYLAQHLPPGTRVVGVDNHSLALERGARLAEQWLEEGGGGDEASDRSANASCAGAPSDSEVVGEENTSRAAGRRGADGERGAALGGPPGARRRACEWLLADLRKEGSLDALRATVIHGHRFKCEQLLPLLRDDVLVPGGYFIWSTFMDTGTENLVPPWRPSRMMRPGELADIFSGNDFEILVDEQGELPTRGSVVPANFFACRKLRSVP